MIVRRHQCDGRQSEAVYSDCEQYRYALTRIWAPDGKTVMFVMLNPSTATELQNDPTVERCERRAKALGFGGFRVTNIFAWRDTDPKNMRNAVDPVGIDNDRAIIEGSDWANQIICAWGTHGAFLNRGPAVIRALRKPGRTLYHLGLSKAGHPKHPLYIAYSQQPEIWA